MLSYFLIFLAISVIVGLDTINAYVMGCATMFACRLNTEFITPGEVKMHRYMLNNILRQFIKQRSGPLLDYLSKSDTLTV